MADQTYWKSIPELSAIALAAATAGTYVRMRGSTAFALRQRAKDGRPLETLFDTVPPIANIDLVIRRGGATELLREYIHASLGDSRFFCWDVNTEEQHSRLQELSNFQTLHGAEVLFTSDVSTETSIEPSAGTFLHVHYDRKKRDIEFIDLGWGPEEVFNLYYEEVSRPEWALADLLLILRSYPNSLKTQFVQKLAIYLNEMGGESVARSFTDRSMRRTEFAYAKYLIKQFSHSSRSNSLQEVLGRAFISTFANNRAESDPLRTMAQLDLDHPKRSDGLICTVVPRQESVHGNTRWIRRIENIQAVNSEDSNSKKELKFDSEVMAEAEPTAVGISVVGPPAYLRTDDPPDPGCCRFKDFDRGVAELVWVDPRGGPKTQRRFGVVAEGEKASFLSVGYLGEPPASSLRCDYNFLCIGAGSSRSLKIYRIDESHAD